MPAKNYGSASSGYNVPDGRAWESVVFLAGKPVLDRELNLADDLDSGAAQETLKALMPSGWIADDFLGSATSGIFTPNSTANILEIPKSLAHVNGWLIRVEYTNANSSVNRLDLDAGPNGAGTTRTDLVILEVWRRLIAVAPDGSGKSALGRIWRNGNVKIPSANDATLNYADDLKDTAINAETTKRVQIQYRLRVIKGVDVISNPYGMGDSNVVATTVPATAASPDGAVYSGPNGTYTNQSANGDPGLWRAGNGVPTNGLGTVDGYMYAVPLCAVFRRNTTAFNRLTNQNGGVASTSTSDRPDGLFHNIIASLDVMDLRTGVSPTGWAPHEVLAKNLNLLLDNALRQEVVNTAPEGGGSRGTTVLRVNEIGGSTTTAGPRIGMFDTVRRRFSDRPTYETVVVPLEAPGGAWANDQTVVIDLSLFSPYASGLGTGYSAFNWNDLAPAQAYVTDIAELHWAGSSGSKKYADALPYVTGVTGVGTLPRQQIIIRLGTIAPLGLTNETLYVTLVFAYPGDSGLVHTPVETYGNSSFELVSAALSTGSPVFFSAFHRGGTVDTSAPTTRSIDASHREAQIEYSTTTRAYTISSGSSPTKVYRLPERASLISSVSTTPAQSGSATLDDSGRIVTLTTTPNANTPMTFNYVAVRPIPAVSNAKMAIYYRAAAPATVNRTVLGTSLKVRPLAVAEKLLTITTGSGSQGESYPFPHAYVQTGGVFAGPYTGTYNGEASMTGSSSIAVANFSADSGMLTLPTYVPMAANPAENLTFSRNTTHVDVEERTYFPNVPAGVYLPNAYAQALSSPAKHKNVLPMLAELSNDSSVGYRGQIVLILLIRYADFDDVNGVFFDQGLHSTSASVFRIKGQLYNRRVS